jgi:uncharacterized RDD family membrane protein YckC
MTDSDAQNPFAPPRAMVEDPYAPQPDMVVAGRGARLGAVIIDGLPIIGVGIVAAIAIPAYLAFTHGRSASIGGTVMLGGLAVLAMIAYLGYSISLVYRFGQTFGKKMMGLRVVRMDGSRVTFARFFFLRYLPLGLIGMIPYIGSLVSLVDSVLIFRDSSRCLHDEIADTRVVTAESSPNATLAGSRIELPTIRA